MRRAGGEQREGGRCEDFVSFRLCCGGLAAAAVFVGTAAGASAEYGPGAGYGVELSANALPGPSFWFWAELDPGGTSGDYQMADCIHVGQGGPPSAGTTPPARWRVGLLVGAC